MKIVLTIKEKEELELQHSKERDRRVADRIKAVLLNAEGWTQKQIAQALRIRYETVQDHLSDYKNSKKLKPENGGLQSEFYSFKRGKVRNILKRVKFRYIIISFKCWEDGKLRSFSSSYFFSLNSSSSLGVQRASNRKYSS